MNDSHIYPWLKTKGHIAEHLMRFILSTLITLTVCTTSAMAQEIRQIDESAVAIANQKPRNAAKQPHGKWVWHNKSTNTIYLIGHYHNGVKHGQWVYHHDNGKPLTRGAYKKGKRTGVWVRWHYNGNFAATGKYKNDNKHGKWTYWFNNMRKWREGVYRHGREDGQWVEWHDNGNLHRRSTFAEDPQNPVTNVLHGLHQSWYENGKQRQKGHYVFNQKHGMWHYWNKKGKQTASGHYKNGKCHGKWLTWDKKGKASQKHYGTKQPSPQP